MTRILGVFMIIVMLTSFANAQEMKVDETAKQATVNWLSWEEAFELNKENPKKIYIDVYTDWCGWCKKMDKTTFQDPEVVKALNENFYAVKFDAEQKEDIVFSDHTFSFVKGGRRGGYHQLAHSLLNGRMGYPAFVVMDEEYSRIMISPGYKKAPDVMMELEFAKEEGYKKMTFDQFKLVKSKDM